ncbi:MAG: peroxiredoxin [Solirubrobacterales bacterium]|nr:peroxiredoxin [Solirubrobacterales bacterium]
MARRPAAGEAAPDFTLDGTDGPFNLSDHRGQRVVLLFYPGDDTPVCTRQFCSYRDDTDTFAQLGAVVVGISAKDLDSKRRFRDKHQLTVPLLADPDQTVAKAYGAWSRLAGTRRAVIVIDEHGTVRHRHDHTLGLDFQTAEEIAAELGRIGWVAGGAA